MPGQLNIFCKATGVLTPHIISNPLKCFKCKSLYLDSNSSGFIYSLAEAADRREKKQHRTYTKGGTIKDLIPYVIDIVPACGLKQPHLDRTFKSLLHIQKAFFFLKTWFRLEKICGYKQQEKFLCELLIVNLFSNSWRGWQSLKLHGVSQNNKRSLVHVSRMNYKTEGKSGLYSNRKLN